ncbi:pneumococcal-type histidine triad protein [uncultured Granulicatella sp.]|uniref:pneumococcal-type histidine triad protein n=1 Tax=uncultured Granulicatella sp. TaxID=316089 RepID=UPI0028D05452|nr:pneumococcal-type histidine triad protein [uncultured Granulicatella sp.]
MKSNRKQLWMAGLASVLAISTVACGITQDHSKQQNQQQAEETTVSNAQMTKFEKLAEEIKNNKPKTIVGEVFENGYLKKHGDHYHFVYGAPPADAIYEQKTSTTKAISSTDDGYVFNPNDIVEENEMGYVVRHGDHFHFIYKNNAQQTIATTMATNSVAHETHEEVEDGYVFDKKDVVSETETGYIVRHGDHFHFIYKDKEGNPVVTAEHHEEGDEHHHHEEEGEHHDHDHDGYVFDKKDVVSETSEGYVVRHGDHFHFIYKDKDGKPAAGAEHHHHEGEKHEHEGEHHDHEGDKHEHEGEHHDADGDKDEHEGEHHDHDGYVFDKKDVVSETSEGYVVRHGDHFHFIYKDKDGKPAAGAEHHHHEGDKHEHESEHHNHEGEHHDHNGDKHEHEGEHHNHDGDKHDHEGEHHDHEGDKHEREGEHHDADGDKDEHEGEHHDHDHDGFVFRKEDIKSETESGYVVRHGNHFHFVYKDKNGKPILDNHHHDHDGDKHEHEGEHHDHDGDKHEHEGEHHDHDGDEHEHEGEHHDHDGDKHEHEGEHHDHDGNKHEHENETTSEDYVSPIPNEKDLTEKSPEVQKYLDYITYAYGVERDTIKLESAYKDGKYVGKVFAFQNMEQGQDKTHIHPWAIPLRNFEVPSSDASIDPELRFAQEIASLAKRMGISVKDIRILGDKFEVPHGDHSHSLKIQNIEGAKKYVANKLKEITPKYVAGDLDTKAVESQIEALANKASEKYKTQPVELSRILTSLREIKERLDEKGNSTQGYLELLKQFDEKYIEKATTVTTSELSKEEKALNTLHESIIRTINDLELTDYNVTKDELRDAANKAIESKDMKALEAVRDYVQALQDANKRLGVEGMKYLYFLTQHVQDKPLPFELREKVSDLIAKLSKAKFIPGETGTTEAIISPSYFATKEIKKAHENPSEKVDTRVGEKYKAIAKPDDEESMSKLAEMKEMAEIALDQEDKDNSIPTSDFTEELSEEVKKDLATPKSKDQATSENTTTPKVEELTANEASTPAEAEKPVVTDKAEETVAPTTETTVSQPATSASEQPHA